MSLVASYGQIVSLMSQVLVPASFRLPSILNSVAHFHGLRSNTNQYHYRPPPCFKGIANLAYAQPSVPEEQPADRKVDVPEVLGYVHSTESFSAIDGPGVRYLVFLQGCPLRCLFCSNPDTWAFKKGTPVSSKAIAAKLDRVLPYIKAGQGGVTCSGGEPLQQPEFVAALFQEAHARGMTTCLDTTGHGTKHHNWDVVLPHVDTVLCCIKHTNPAKYLELTGQKQVAMLHFLEELNARKIPFWIRWVLLPGLSDSESDINELIAFCKRQETLQGIEMLPYHMLGVEKWKTLNLEYPLSGLKPPTLQVVDRVVQQLRDAGITVMCDTAH